MPLLDTFNTELWRLPIDQFLRLEQNQRRPVSSIAQKGSVEWRYLAILLAQFDLRASAFARSPCKLRTKWNGCRLNQSVRGNNKKQRSRRRKFTAHNTTVDGCSCVRPTTGIQKLQPKFKLTKRPIKRPKMVILHQKKEVRKKRPDKNSIQQKCNNRKGSV